jgi:hypothetical protein
MDVYCALILVLMRCGYYYFDAVQMFLFRSGAVVVVSFVGAESSPDTN